MTEGNYAVPTELDVMFDTYQSQTPYQQAEKKLETYNHILQHKAAYQAFNQTCYPLGREGTIASFFGSAPLEDRLIHFHNAADTSLQSIIPFQSNRFVNAAHAQLFLQHTFGFSPNASSANHLINILHRLEHNTDEIEAVLASDTDGRMSDDLLQSLDATLKDIVQQYLRDNLSQLEKNELMHAIRHAFKFIDSSTSTSNSPITKACVTALKAQLADDLFDHIHALAESNLYDLSTSMIQPHAPTPQEETRRHALIQQKQQQLEELKQQLDELAQAIPEHSSYQARLKQEAATLDTYLTALKQAHLDRLQLPKPEKPQAKPPVLNQPKPKPQQPATTPLPKMQHAMLESLMNFHSFMNFGMVMLSIVAQVVTHLQSSAVLLGAFKHHALFKPAHRAVASVSTAIDMPEPTGPQFR